MICRLLMLMVLLSALPLPSSQAQTQRQRAALAAQRADSLVTVVDSVRRVDSLLVAADSIRVTDSVQVMGFAPISRDSARKVDSAAVASLADTSQSATAAVGVKTPVKLQGKRIFDIYGGLGPYSAADRAERLSRRLESMAANEALDPDSLRIVDGLSLTTLQIGEASIMSITDADAEALAQGRHQAAVAYREQIIREVRDLRERSTFRSVLINLGYAAALLLVLILLLRGVRWVFHRLQTQIASWEDTRIRAVHIRGIESFSATRATESLITVTRLVHVLTVLLLVYLYLTTVFALLPWTRSWSANLLSYIIVPVVSLGRGLLHWLPNGLAIAVIVVLIRWLIRGTNAIFERISRGELQFTGFYPEFSDPTRKIVRFLLIILGVMLIYPYTPIVNSPVFQGLSLFLGILFSLGSSTAIGNMVAGLVLTYTRAFRMGDRIKVGETTGDVIEKTFLVTRVRTPKNEDVAIPNMTMISSQIVNYSSMARDGGAGLILHTTITIGYDVPWPQVHALLIESARRTVDVEPTPSPFVLQTSLGDFSVAYQLNAYTHRPDRMARLYSDLHQNLQDTFAEAGIEILSPVYEAARDGSPLTIPKLAGSNGQAPTG